MLLVLFAIFQSLANAADPPPIKDLLKPAIFKSALEDREIVTHADLDDGKKYSYYSTMLVRAGVARAREVLTDYKLYAEMIPYVEKAEFNAEKKILELIGGIWKFKLISTLQFASKGDRWIEYRVIEGHFKGLAGDLMFESQGEKGTLVMMRGALESDQWPPALLLEQGAQIVFGFTAKRMRSYLEKK